MPIEPRLTSSYAGWMKLGATPEDLAQLELSTDMVRRTPNQNPALNALVDVIRNRVRGTRFQRNPDLSLGTLADWFPSLAQTKSGVDLRDVQLFADRANSGRAFYYNGGIHVAPSPDWVLQQGDITREQDLAQTLGHEVIHAARHALGRSLKPDRTLNWLDDLLPAERVAILKENNPDLAGVHGISRYGWETMRAPGKPPEVKLREPIPYFRQPFEESARRGQGYIGKALLENRPGPLLGIAAVPGLLDMLSQWSRTEGTNPASEFARGAVNTLSPSGAIPSANEALDAYNVIADPTSPSGQRGGSMLGKFGLEQIMGIAQLLQTNPNELIKHIIQSVARNPAYGAGSGLAMALPSPGEFLKMAKGEALSASEKLAQQHVADWNVHAYEGATGPLGDGGKGFELQELKAALADPENNLQMGKHERALIQARIAQLEGGVWTREERGGEMLQQLGIPDVTQQGSVNDIADLVTQNFHDLQDLRNRGFDATTADAFRRGALPPQAASERLAREYPTAPLGQRMFQNGDEWVNTSRGWTLNPDAVKPSGPHAPPNLIAQVARVTRDKGAAWGVEEAIRHGGMDPKNASTLVANTLAQWSAAKVRLTPEQNAWLELYRAGKYKP